MRFFFGSTPLKVERRIHVVLNDCVHIISIIAACLKLFYSPVYAKDVGRHNGSPRADVKISVEDAAAADEADSLWILVARRGRSSHDCTNYFVDLT